jgi:hypothetical protein
MSIREYLKELDTNQLQFAIQEANNIIEDRKNQEKVPIYLVSDEDCNHYALPVGKEDQAIDAAIRGLECQRTQLKEWGVACGNIQVNISVEYKPQEVADKYLEELKWRG